MVTAVLSEPDDSHDDAEQADGPQQGDAQVLLARIPEADSPRVPPRPAQAPVSPAPTILAKNVTQQAPPAPLRRAMPPAAAPQVTPDTAGPAQATPLPSPSKELRAAIPRKDPPLLLARIPEADSPRVPPRPAQGARISRSHDPGQKRDPTGSPGPTPSSNAPGPPHHM